MSTAERRRPTKFLQSPSSSLFGTNPGILGSMNCLRNSWLDAMSVKALNSSTVNSKVNFFMASRYQSVYQFLPGLPNWGYLDRFQLFLKQLFPIQCRVITAGRHQLGVCSLLNYAPPFQHDNPAGLANGRHAVRDQNYRAGTHHI